MTFANNMDRDQAPHFVGPDLRSILFETQHQFLLKTRCFAWDDLNSADIQILSISQIIRELY